MLVLDRIKNEGALWYQEGSKAHTEEEELTSAKSKGTEIKVCKIIYLL